MIKNPKISLIGDKRWYDKNNKLHRKNGPAFEAMNGYKSWWIHGKCHRIDGPACGWVNGKRWFLNGKEYYTEEQFHLQISKLLFFESLIREMKIL